MSLPARQSTSLELAVGPVLDADGVAVTDCVVGDFKIKKTTGNFAALNGSATLTHVSAGVYDLVLTTSDTDTVGMLTIAIDDTVNACPLVRLQVIEEVIYDALYAASANAFAGAAGSTTLGAGAITDTSIAANAITDAKVASDVTIASVTGAVGSVTGNVGGNVTGSVGSVASGGITEASFATTAGSFAPLGIVDQGTAQSATGTTVVLRSAAAFANDTLIGCVIAVFGSTQGYWQERVITDNTLSDDTVTVDTWTVTPSGTITYKIFMTPSAPASAASTIAAAVWDLATSGHTNSGTFGEAMNAAGSAGDPWTTTLPGSYTGSQAGKVLADVLVDTATLPSDPADASVIAARFDTLDTSIADLPTNAELATALGTADDAVLAQISVLSTAIGDLPTNAELATALGTADDAVLTQIALVKAKTDQLVFTVSNTLNVNVRYVNGVQIDGAGTTGDPWGPA